jgi:ribonucleoside-diphosphate reductase alpha chain
MSMEITPLFCDEMDPFESVDWDKRNASIIGEGDEVIFSQTDIDVPVSWSQTALNIVASKYFYGEQDTDERETSIRQLIHRVTKTVTDWGIEDGYFDKENGEVFYRELTWLCLHQHMAFNSPVWFNVGIWQEYGVTGTPCGFTWNDGEILPVQNPHEEPQVSACFIQSVADNMEDIMRFATDEAMLFKFGSGVGADLSTLRGSCEKLSGGGRASGPLSFARIYNMVAEVVKSGGKTRRAALLFSIKDSHPDLMQFIQCKAREEAKAATLVGKGYSPQDAYMSVLYQNANLSVRLSDEFMIQVNKDGDWYTRWVTDSAVSGPHHKARAILRAIAEAAWECGDPGVQFDTALNKWHTCPVSGRINASNPCGEYNYLDNSACNLASLNLMKFRQQDGSLNVSLFQAAARIALITQDIMVDRASYPSAKIAQTSHRHRALGLGYSNLGSFVMSNGVAYDSELGRSICAGITAIITGTAYAASAEIAEHLSPFEDFELNRTPMLEVMSEHYAALGRMPMPAYLAEAAHIVWKHARTHGDLHGYRNAQTTVLAPTGTISFMMDCSTFGIEPDLALMKYKRLAGGGTLKMVNKSVPKALRFLGYAEDDIDTLMAWVEEKGTFEGSLLKPDHLSVFDTALAPQGSSRSIAASAHLKMLAAAQPFLSGAISKTINMPASATVQDFEDAIIKAWRLGLKSVTLYRDGSKSHQPLNTALDKKGASQSPPKQVRRPLPDERKSVTKKISISGHEGYVTVGLYPDGTPGELFIAMSKEGSTISGMMDAFSIAVSLGFQHGVPMTTFVDKFAYMQFEPMGFTKDADIKMAKSIVDFIFRWMQLRFQISEVATTTSETTDQEATPICDQCGSMTVRSGSCYLCYNCGTSMGCS